MRLPTGCFAATRRRSVRSMSGSAIPSRSASQRRTISPKSRFLSRTTMDTTGAGSPRQSSSICARHMPQTGRPSSRSGAGARIPGRWDQDRAATTPMARDPPLRCWSPSTAPASGRASLHHMFHRRHPENSGRICRNCQTRRRTRPTLYNWCRLCMSRRYSPRHSRTIRRRGYRHR